MEEITEEFFKDFNKLEISWVGSDGVAISKAGIFRQILLYGNELPLNKEQLDLVSQTILFYSADQLRYEPLIVEAAKRCLWRRKETRLALLGTKGLEIVFTLVFF